MSKNNSYEKFRQTCLLGKVDIAISSLTNSDFNSFSSKQNATYRVIKKRFSRPYKKQPSQNNSVKELISIYEHYWHQSLTDIENCKKYERQLISELKKWLLTHYKSFSRSKNCFQQLKKYLELQGFYCLVGKVAHLQELEIWKNESKRMFDIQLLESKQKVSVVFMKNYKTFGWMDYATCGRSKVGGWAKRKALYCNLKEYKIKSENFFVSYLTHEAQHFSDYKKFKKLDSFALEYRAKLAELVSSKRTTKKLIKRFSAQSSKDRHSFHHYAAFKVIKDFGPIVGKTNPEIRLKAQKLLLADTLKRQKTGFDSL